MIGTNMQYVIWAAIVVVVVAAGWFYYADVIVTAANPPAQSETTEGGESTYMPVPGSNTPEMYVAPSSQKSGGVTVTYTADGFVPKTVTILQGESVTFTNESGRDMWVASAMHPAHSVYSGTTRTEHCPDTSGIAFDQCTAGETYTFTFTKTGTWQYHDHLASQYTGAVIVQ